MRTILPALILALLGATPLAAQSVLTRATRTSDAAEPALVHPDQIAAAHRHYEHWWLALDWVRQGLRDGGMLRSIDVTDAMPKRQPWARPTGHEQISNKTV